MYEVVREESSDSSLQWVSARLVSMETGPWCSCFFAPRIMANAQTQLINDVPLDIAVQHDVGHFLEVRVQARGNKSSQTICHGDVCHFTARVLDMFLPGGFPLVHAKQNFRIRRHTFNIMHSLRETLSLAGVLSFVSSQKLAIFVTVWKGFPFVFCAKMLKSC